MPFPDTNYGKQNKKKKTLKPIIIRPLMQTRWGEAGAYQLLEVITKPQTIFHPQTAPRPATAAAAGPEAPPGELSLCRKIRDKQEKHLENTGSKQVNCEKTMYTNQPAS